MSVDMSAYKQEFLNETRDHLDSLNECLLVLEKSPEDTENLNKLFRSFHTLKGNSAAMGYSNYSELAHKLEDLLDKVRNGKLTPDQKIIDILFEGCDILEEGLGMIEESNSDNIEISSVVESVESLLGKEETVEVKVSEKVELNEDERNRINNSGKNAFRIIVVFDKKSVVRQAKVQIIIRDLSANGEIIKTTPAREDITSGKFSDEVEIILVTEKSKNDIINTVHNISGILDSQVIGIDEIYSKKQIIQKEVSKEHAKAAIADKHSASVVRQISSIKIDIKKLDNLMNMVGELLINKMRLQQIAKKHDIDELNRVMKLVDRLTDDIQDNVTKARMIPIGNIFNRFPRMVRDLAKKENKNVELKIEGEDIEFDRNILDELGDPIVHLLRNSVDHGVESPDERTNAGKNATGIVSLIAKRDKNNALVIVSDDGYGIDAQKVKESSISKGLITKAEADKMSENDIKRLIFRPGVSTNKEITDVSGRGVGMDVVETKVKALGGVVMLDSTLGKGTTVTLKLPLTISIVTCLLFRIAQTVYAVPIINVSKTVRLLKSDIKSIQNHPVFLYMGKEIALLSLRDIFNMPTDEEKSREKFTVLVVDNGNEFVGLIVDEIISQEQIMIKKLDKNLKNTKGIAGNTILGDGTVGIIIDVNNLF